MKGIIINGLNSLILLLGSLFLSCNPLEKKIENTSWYLGPKKLPKGELNLNTNFEIITFKTKGKIEFGRYYSENNSFFLQEFGTNGDLVHTLPHWYLAKDTLFLLSEKYLKLNISESDLILKNLKNNKIEKWKRIAI